MKRLPMNVLRSRFANNLMINFLFVSALSLAMFSILNYVVNRRELIHQTHWELQQISREQALMVGETLLDDVDLLNTLAIESVVQTELQTIEQDYAKQSEAIEATVQRRNQQWSTASDDDPFIKNISEGQMAQALEDFLDRFGVYSDVMVTDRYGALVAATYPVEKYYQGEETWWKDVWNDGQGCVYISQPFIDNAQPNPIAEIVIASPIYRNEQIVGSIHGIYPLDYVLDNLEDSALALAGWELASPTSIDEKQDETQPETLSYSDTSGIRLYISPQQYLESDQIKNNAPTTTQLLTNPSERPVDFEGEQSFIASTPVYTLTDHDNAEEQRTAQAIENSDWRILAYLEQQEALSPLKISAFLALGTSIIILIVAIGLAAILAKKISHPVQVLIDTARKIQSNSQTPDDLQPLDEIAAQDTDIGELATVFSDMTRSLIDRQQTLSKEVATLKTQIRAGLQQTRIRTGTKQASGIELAYYEALLKKSIWLRQKSSKPKVDSTK